MFFILDLIFDLFMNAYISLGYGTPQRKIEVKIEKLSKEYPEIMNLYKSNINIFESDPELSKIVLKSKINNKELRDRLVSEIHSFFNTYKKTGKQHE